MNKVAIYGVGVFGEIFFKALEKNIDFFIDDFSQDMRYYDKEIKKVEDVPKGTKIYIEVVEESK